MIKILMLSDPNNTHTQRWVTSLSQYVSIYVYGLTAPQFDWYSKLNNVRVAYHDFSGNVDNTKDGALNKLSYLKIIKNIISIERDYSPDIIHGHYASSYGLLASLLKHKRLIQSVWGSDVFLFPKISIFHKIILKYNLRCANLIESSSQIMAKEIRKYNKATPIQIVPFGVDFGEFGKTHSSLEKGEKDFIIGTAKSLYPIYGIDYLIKAVKILIDRNAQYHIKLIILGSGPEYASLNKLTKELNIESNVVFVGRVENSEMPKYYNYFDVAAFLSNSESFGVSAIEALACYCPVVVSDAPGFLEVVKKGGYIVRKKDPQAAADKIQLLIDNPALRAQLANEGHSYMKEKYDWEKCVATQIQIYNQIVGS